MQVRILPGVLCPKLKWATRRDVAPEEAGSSPAGHPSTTPYYGRQAYVVRDQAALAQLEEASGLGPEGSGFESLEPHRESRPGNYLSGTLEERRNQA